MSAEVLCQAASLMRERAESATSSEWVAQGGLIVASPGPTAKYVADCFDEPGASEADAEHIASWHPAVALAVANLLENEASLIASAEEHPDLHLPLNGSRVDLLLAIARAYLGEAS